MKKTFIYDKIYKSEMQKTTNTNLAKYFSLAIIVYLGLNLTSCASGYFCTLNSRGEIPSDKTYYIVSVDSTETHYLEFQEYVSILEKRLGEIGYIESNPQKASRSRLSTKAKRGRRRSAQRADESSSTRRVRTALGTAMRGPSGRSCEPPQLEKSSVAQRRGQLGEVVK